MRGRTLQFNYRGVIFWLGAAVASLSAYLAFGQFIPQARLHALEAQAKQNMHAVQLGLERMAVDDPGSNCPYDINEIVRRGYLPELPLNPFAHRPMRGVSFDLPPRENGPLLENPELPRLSPEDFVYVRRYGEGYVPGQPANGLPVIGYTLVLY
jgi:hypothetical protein